MSGWVHLWRTLREMCVGAQWHCYALGDFLLAWSRAALGEKGHSKSIHSYPMMKISILMGVISRMRMPRWGCTEWTDGIAFTVTRSQPNWTPMNDFGATCQPTVSTTTIKTPIKEIIFVRTVFIQFKRLVESVPRHTGAVLVTHGGLTPQ